jgi:hypothetical protein
VWEKVSETQEVVGVEEVASSGEFYVARFRSPAGESGVVSFAPDELDVGWKIGFENEKGFGERKILATNEAVFGIFTPAEDGLSEIFSIRASDGEFNWRNSTRLQVAEGGLGLAGDACVVYGLNRSDFDYEVAFYDIHQGDELDRKNAPTGQLIAFHHDTLLICRRGRGLYSASSEDWQWERLGYDKVEDVSVGPAGVYIIVTDATSGLSIVWWDATERSEKERIVVDDGDAKVSSTPLNEEGVVAIHKYRGFGLRVHDLKGGEELWRILDDSDLRIRDVVSTSAGLTVLARRRGVGTEFITYRTAGQIIDRQVAPEAGARRLLSVGGDLLISGDSATAMYRWNV